MAASVPVPIAMPRSAVASAAASLTPSPIIATFRPSACSARTVSTLSPGRTSANTSSMPTSAATVSAAVAESPVSSTGRSPSARSRAIASAELGRTVSATSMTPIGSPSAITTTAVRPAARPWSKAVRSSAGSSPPASAGRPTLIRRPSTIASAPRPGRFVKSSTRWLSEERSESPTRWLSEERSESSTRWLSEERSDESKPLSYPRTMARAIGCSELSSTAAASRSTSASVTPATGRTPATDITPVVTVPVLSSTTVSTARVSSRTSGPLITMPSWAPRPVPTSSAVGVARPSAQGQAMINTATAAVNAKAVPAPSSSQVTRVITDSAITIGTKMPEIRSASRCTWALPVCASSTIRAIWASWVSWPTRVARTTIRPSAFRVAPITSSPGATSTGTDSPVTRELSMLVRPVTTTPSVATFSPGRTTNSSPTASWSIGTRCSTPSRSTETSLAPRVSRARTASPARRLARASK